MRLSLSMAKYLDLLFPEFERVVLFAEFAGIEKNSEKLWVIAGGPLRQDQQGNEDHQTAKEAAEEVKSRRPQAEGGKEQPSLGSQNGQWLVDRSVHRINTTALHCFDLSLTCYWLFVVP